MIHRFRRGIAEEALGSSWEDGGLGVSFFDHQCIMTVACNLS